MKVVFESVLPFYEHSERAALSALLFLGLG